jgi:hypothetical protein
MKASELIEKLNEYINAHGDYNVYVLRDGEYGEPPHYESPWLEFDSNVFGYTKGQEEAGVTLL